MIIFNFIQFSVKIYIIFECIEEIWSIILINYSSTIRKFTNVVFFFIHEQRIMLDNYKNQTHALNV